MNLRKDHYRILASLRVFEKILGLLAQWLAARLPSAERLCSARPRPRGLDAPRRAGGRVVGCGVDPLKVNFFSPFASVLFCSPRVGAVKNVCLKNLLAFCWSTVS